MIILEKLEKILQASVDSEKLRLAISYTNYAEVCYRDWNKELRVEVKFAELDKDNNLSWIRNRDITFNLSYPETLIVYTEFGFNTYNFTGSDLITYQDLRKKAQNLLELFKSKAIELL